MKRIQRRVLLTFAAMLVLFSGFAYGAAGNAPVESRWVYDETGSLTDDTISYIQELNENALKDYQYAVYIVNSLEGASMDSYKLSLFNKLGVGSKEKNSGILFVLAVADRKYGLEIGEGITGGLRNTLSNDFLSNSAISALKASDWNSAVREVSAQLNELVISGSTNGDSEKSPIFMYIAIGVISIALCTNLIFLLVTLQKRHRNRKFVRTEEVQRYVSYYGINEKALMKHLKRTKGDRDLRLVWDYVVTHVAKQLSVFPADMKKLFSFEDFRAFRRGNIAQSISDFTSQWESVEKKNLIALDIVYLEKQSNAALHSGYASRAVVRIQKLLHWRQARDKLYSEAELSQLFDRKYREVEIESMMESYLDERLGHKEDVLKRLRQTQEYEDYVSGKTERFIPPESVRNSEAYRNDGSYFQDDNNIWFWLWLYTVNTQQHVHNEYIHQQEAQNSDVGSFGGGFGGGSSSGGGFSGSF